MVKNRNNSRWAFTRCLLYLGSLTQASRKFGKLLEMNLSLLLWLNLISLVHHSILKFQDKLRKRRRNLDSVAFLSSLHKPKRKNARSVPSHANIGLHFDAQWPFLLGCSSKGRNDHENKAKRTFKKIKICHEARVPTPSL